MASENALPRGLALAPSGRLVYITGVTKTGGTTTAHFAADGSVAWRAVEPWSALAIVAGRDRVYVGGTGTDGEPAVAAYDASTGMPAWRTAGPYAFLPKMALDPKETRVFVSSADGTTAFDAATGKIEWHRGIGAGAFLGQSIAAAPSGKAIYVSSGDVVALDARDGRTLWKSTYQPASAHLNSVVITSVADSADGARVFAVGTDGLHFIALAFAADSGHLIWVDRAHRHGWGTAIGMFVTAAGGRVFSLGAEDEDSYTGFVTTAYDATTGARMWTRSKNVCNRPAGVAAGLDGRDVIITGGCGGNFATISYSAQDGAVRWSRTLVGPRGSSAGELVVGKDGTVFVTGLSAGTFGGPINVITVAFRP